MDGLMVERNTETDAARRLRGYFRTFGFDDPAVLDRLTRTILAETGPEASAEAAVMRARDLVEDWLAGALGPAIGAAGEIEAIGRAAFLMSGSAQRWPQQFLAPEEPSAELCDALRRAALPPIPHAAVAMPEQDLAVAWSPVAVFQLLRRSPAKAPQS